MKKNIAVIGLGKLGYPMAEYLSSSGLTIKCYDNDVSLLKNLKSGYNPLEFENQLLNTDSYILSKGLLLSSLDSSIASAFRFMTGTTES